ncbi:endo alpha-1,4 polygalactosaminidase [Streptomyces sp. NPDC047043]|uniref:endo alpha-1,4 polygalactosaminidase n=1 Tax=Streptomyces sp. NPDC047043 TaxID=3154497 RepID=UPI0033E07EC9
MTSTRRSGQAGKAERPVKSQQLLRAVLYACCIAVFAGCAMPAGVKQPDRTRAGTPAPTSPDEITNAVVQLQGYKDGKLDELARGRYQLAVIDLARDASASYFSADEISRLKQSGKKVLAYFEIGSLEWFRPDYPSFRKKNPDLIIGEWSDWPGEYFVKYWDRRWWEEAIKPRVDRAIAAGFDGVFLDTVVAYDEIDLHRLPGESRDDLGAKMVGLIRRISEYAKATKPGFWVFPLNAPELQRHPGYRDAIDGIGVEGLFFQATDVPCNEDFCAPKLKATRALRRAGKIVFAVDYADRPQNIATACRNYRKEHFAGYVTVRDLDQVRPPCP